MGRKQKELLAERTINPRAYKLKNGNLLIETELLDSVHLIHLELEIDPNRKQIVKARAEMRSIPYVNICPKVLTKVKKLKGLIIKKGVLKEVAEILGGPRGCVHLRNLATIAIDFSAGFLAGFEGSFDYFSPEFERQPEKEHYEISKKFFGGTCIAFPKEEGNDDK